MLINCTIKLTIRNRMDRNKTYLDLDLYPVPDLNPHPDIHPDSCHYSNHMDNIDHIPDRNNTDLPIRVLHEVVLLFRDVVLR